MHPWVVSWQEQQALCQYHLPRKHIANKLTEPLLSWLEIIPSQAHVLPAEHPQMRGAPFYCWHSDDIIVREAESIASFRELTPCAASH